MWIGGAVGSGSLFEEGHGYLIKLSKCGVLSKHIHALFPVYLWCVSEIKQRTKTKCGTVRWGSSSCRCLQPVHLPVVQTAHVCSHFSHSNILSHFTENVLISISIAIHFFTFPGIVNTGFQFQLIGIINHFLNTIVGTLPCRC